MKLFGKKNNSQLQFARSATLKFTQEERMLRHMAKAHSRPVGWKNSN